MHHNLKQTRQEKRHTKSETGGKVTYKYYGDIKDRKSRMRTPRTICQILITQEGEKKTNLSYGKESVYRRGASKNFSSQSFSNVPMTIILSTLL